LYRRFAQAFYNKQDYLLESDLTKDFIRRETGGFGLNEQRPLDMLPVRTNYMGLPLWPKPKKRSLRSARRNNPHANQ
jgi:hypothetical protein